MGQELLAQSKFGTFNRRERGRYNLGRVHTIKQSSNKNKMLYEWKSLKISNYTLRLFQNPVLREKRQGLSI